MLRLEVKGLDDLIRRLPTLNNRKLMASAKEK